MPRPNSCCNPRKKKNHNCVFKNVKLINENWNDVFQILIRKYVCDSCRRSSSLTVLFIILICSVWRLETEWERRSAETILLYKEYCWINMHILRVRARQVAASLQALRDDVQVQITFIQRAIHFFSQRHIFKKRKKYMRFFFESKYDIEDNFF